MRILFYGEDGTTAKAVAMARRAKGERLSLVHASACHEREDCDGVEFLDDVSAFDRVRLSALFGVEVPAVEPGMSNPYQVGPSIGKGPGGRWYVKRGKTIVTGPYATEDEATAAKDREPV